MNFSDPELPQNFNFFEIFVTFLKMQKVKNITKDIDNGVKDNILEAWDFDEFIDNFQIPEDDPFVLEFEDCMANDCYDFLLPARERVHLESAHEF